MCILSPYRWMWVGDSVATLVGDGCQLILLLWTCIHFNEPILQIGVRATPATSSSSKLQLELEVHCHPLVA
jgi:hypothetical protein